MKGCGKLIHTQTTLEIAKECIHCEAYSDSAACKAFGDDCWMWLHGYCKDFLREGEKKTKVDFLWKAIGKSGVKEGDILKKGV